MDSIIATQDDVTNVYCYYVYKDRIFPFSSHLYMGWFKVFEAVTFYELGTFKFCYYWKQEILLIMNFFYIYLKISFPYNKLYEF